MLVINAIRKRQIVNIKLHLLSHKMVQVCFATALVQKQLLKQKGFKTIWVQWAVSEPDSDLMKWYRTPSLLLNLAHKRAHSHKRWTYKHIFHRAYGFSVWNQIEKVQFACCRAVTVIFPHHPYWLLPVYQQFLIYPVSSPLLGNKWHVFLAKWSTAILHFLDPPNHHHLLSLWPLRVCINITLLNPLVTADKSHNSYGCSRLKICHLSLNICCFGAFGETADAVIFLGWIVSLHPFSIDL